jgi:nucleoside-diphosphate-sugar epimerase
MDCSRTRVCIIGSRGFIGRHLAEWLSPKCSLTCVAGRSELDLANKKDVDAFFGDKTFDVVFLCVSSGGSRLKPESEATESENIAMVDHVMYHADRFQTLVLFGSGAEYDRTLPVNSATSDFSKLPPPGQWYGRGKYQIRQKYGSHPKVVIWRIFSCFGPGDLPQRFVQSCLDAKRCDRPVAIDKDRLFDFVDVEHVAKWALMLVQGKSEARKSMDLCYRRKKYLSEVAKEIGVTAIVEEKSDLCYIGE